MLLKELWTWAHPQYDQKVFKPERFRYDFIMVLNRYQLMEISQPHEPLKLLVRCCLKGFGAQHVQNTRKELLKGIRGSARTKSSQGVA